MQEERSPTSHRQKAIQAFMHPCEASSEEEAVYYLELCNFDVQKAILCYFENPVAGKRFLHKNSLAQKYANYIKLKGGPPSKRELLLSCVDRGIRRVCQELKILWKEIVPQKFRGLTSGQLFREKYGLHLNWVTFEEFSLSEALRRASDSGKPLAIYEYVQHFHHNAITVFTIETTQLLNWQYLLIGIGRQDQEVRSFLRNECGLPESTECSSLTILRVNHCKEVVLVSHLKLTENVNAMNVYNYFHETLSLISEEKALEAEIVALTEQKRTEEVAQITSPNSHISHEGHNGSELMEPQFEMQGVQIHETPARVDSLRQNPLLDKEEEFVYEPQKQSKIGLLSETQPFGDRDQSQRGILHEPEDGEGVITISFRLPKGGRLFRRFHRANPISEIFEFVEHSKQVEFSMEKPHGFDLLTVLGGRSLEQVAHAKIQDIFGEEAQETLIVKEL